MLVAGSWSFRVTCNEPLCLGLWGLAYSFRFSGCSFFTGAFVPQETICVVLRGLCSLQQPEEGNVLKGETSL